MKKKRISYIIVLVVLSCSLFFNVLLLSPFIKWYIELDRTPYYDINASDEEVIESVIHASLKLDCSQMKKQEFHGVVEDVFNMFELNGGSDCFNNYYEAYNYVGLSQYAVKSHNKELLTSLREKADGWIGQDGQLNYELVKIDQCPIGIFYLNLYSTFDDVRYLKVAGQIYDFLLSKRMDDGLIPYNNTEINLSDALGMIVPFLMEYHYHTGDSLSRVIAQRNIEIYRKYATDYYTHLPFHGYDISTKSKLGSCNWGRGIGWYLLAIAYCDEMNDDVLWNSVQALPYTQFPMSSNTFDSSTALLFEIYKQKMDKSRQLDLQFIKPHIRKNGIVADCSGDTYGLNEYSKSFGNSELCNGLFLMLVSCGESEI